MAQRTRTAYVTGGASGIGKAVVQLLVSKRVKTVIADINHTAAEDYAETLNKEYKNTASSSGQIAIAVAVDVTSWESHVNAFSTALPFLEGRVDYVFAIAGVGERRWLRFDADSDSKFLEPDMTTLEVDLKGPLLTSSLAIQQMRRQAPLEDNFRGSVAIAASTAGFHFLPALPIYTTAKHGLVGFVRTYGKIVAEYGIALNAVCPMTVRTNISTQAFYDAAEAKGLLTPMDKVQATFEACMHGFPDGGACLEVSPDTDPFINKEPDSNFNQMEKDTIEMINSRAMALHTKLA